MRHGTATVLAVFIIALFVLNLGLVAAGQPSVGGGSSVAG